MKILVVDDQAESASALAQSLREATSCDVFSAAGGEQALETTKRNGAPDVLITEVVMEGIDGFALRESLLAARPELRTIYVTGYDLSEYKDYINGTPVFYKPVDPKEVLAALGPLHPARKSASITASLPPEQRTQSARLKRLVDKQGFTGKLDQFELIDIIQMCCVSKRTGSLRISRRADRGVIYLKGGQIIHAVSGEMEGDEAVYQIIGWSAGQFNFDEGVQPEVQTIQSGWEHLVMEAVRRRDEKQHAEGGDDEESSIDPTLAGQTVGPYKLRRKLGQGERSQVFEALQVSMDRVVALKALLPEFQQDEYVIQHFLAEASAKANVQHPSILAVYEAGHANDVYYYAREFVDGSNLTDLRAQGRTIDDPTALQLIRVAAEALSYLNLQKIPHAPLAADDLYLGRDKHARLNNIAIVPEEKTPPTQQDIHTLSHMVADCLPGRSAATPGLRALLGRMLLEGNGGFLSWGALLQAVKALEPKVVPQDAFKLSAQDAAAVAAVNEAKRRQKRSLILGTIGAIILFWLIGFVAYFKFIRTPVSKDFDQLVAVPAGEFIYQEGEKKKLPDFWIDQYEVTIGQYAEFLDALKAKPTTAYEHPDAPSSHHHDNTRWSNLYQVARTNGTYNGAPVTLDCPAVFIDWFDAYAYAKWKGRRLPTEVEWEKAARGTDGRRFPWGDDMVKILSKVNTSIDFNEKDGSVKGGVDGYNRWSPVDAMTSDKSPYGVMDMAGNVSEWTATMGSKDHPVIRGGNFGSPDVEVIRRVDSIFNIQTQDRVGFRTVSDSPPEVKAKK